MNLIPPVIVAAILLGAAAPAAGASTPSTSPDASPLNSVERAFRASQNMSALPEAGEGSTTIQVPELVGPPPAGSPGNSPRTPVPYPAVNRNWLVDGVMKQPDKDEQDFGSGGEQVLRSAAKKPVAFGGVMEPNQQDLSTAALNPLQQFMGSWLSGSNPAFAAELLGASTSKIGRSASEVLNPARSKTFERVEFMPAPPTLASRAPEKLNPYLAPAPLPRALNESMVGGGGSDFLVRAAPAATSLPPLPPLISSPKPAVQHDSKPTVDDHKYFKQLKRF